MSSAKAELAKLLAPPRPPKSKASITMKAPPLAKGNILGVSNREPCQTHPAIQQTKKMDRLQRSSAAHVKPKTAIDNSSFGKVPTLKDITGVSAGHYCDNQLRSENLGATIHYLTEYLNQLVLDNCQLKIDLGQREKDVRWLQAELLRREEETGCVKRSKNEIAESVRRISQYNESYIAELQRKDREIDELKRKLLEAPYLLTDRNDDSDTDEGFQSRARPRCREIREEIMGKRDVNLSTVSSSSVLESAKKYVANVRSGFPKTFVYGPTNADAVFKNQ